MKKKLVLLALGISCSVLIGACGFGNKTEDPLTGEETTTQEATDEPLVMEDNAIERDFDTVLGNAKEPGEIIDYINTNIATASETDIGRFFEGLFGFGDNVRDIDFTRLEQSRQYMPEDMIAFMDLMRLERETPSMVMADTGDRMEIGMTLSEMLERAVLFEQHIDKYPDHTSTQVATQLYEEIVTAAISGGYDRENNIPHYYQGETEDKVDENSIEYYEQFAAANPDTRVGALVNDYVQLLKDNDFTINEQVEEFYRSINSRLHPVVENNMVDDNVTGDNAGTVTDENGTNASGAAEDIVVE